MGQFSVALAYTLANEGAAYVADPADRGICSRFGVTRASLTAWRGKPCTCDDVKKLELPEVTAFYKLRYWDAMRLDDVGPQATATALFDMGVLNGVTQAVKGMQQCVGVVTDGKLGPLTLAAINGYASSFVVPLYVQLAQLRFLHIVRSDSSQAKWLPNWLHRTTKLMILAV